jgi:hypothetical protein
VDKYRAMKEEIRKKMAAGSSVIDEETKNGLIKLGREQARESVIKKLASAMPPSAWTVCDVDGDRKQMAFGATVELYALLVNPTCWLYSCALRLWAFHCVVDRMF